MLIRNNTANVFYWKPISIRKINGVFITEEEKETILDFSQGTVKVFKSYFALIWYQYNMTHCNILNEKLSNSQLNELKSGIKNSTEVTLNFYQRWLVNIMMILIFCINYY